MLIKNSVRGFLNKVYKSKHSLWVPMFDILVPKNNNVIAILDTPQGKIHLAFANIVANAGEIYYGQKATGAAPTNVFANLYLSTVAWTSAPAAGSDSDGIASMIAGAEKAPTATYPKVSDADVDNTGAGANVISWAYAYAKADFNDADIAGGAIAVAGVTSWGAGAGTDPVLCAFDVVPIFGKTANDTLKYFVNHALSGM